MSTSRTRQRLREPEDRQAPRALPQAQNRADRPRASTSSLAQQSRRTVRRLQDKQSTTRRGLGSPNKTRPAMPIREVAPPPATAIPRTRRPARPAPRRAKPGRNPKQGRHDAQGQALGKSPPRSRAATR